MDFAATGRILLTSTPDEYDILGFLAKQIMQNDIDLFVITLHVYVVMYPNMITPVRWSQILYVINQINFYILTCECVYVACLIKHAHILLCFGYITNLYEFLSNIYSYSCSKCCYYRNRQINSSSGFKLLLRNEATNLNAILKKKQTHGWCMLLWITTSWRWLYATPHLFPEWKDVQSMTFLWMYNKNYNKVIKSYENYVRRG